MTDGKHTDLELLDKSVDELDLLLGEALVAGELGAKDLSDHEKQATGQRWLASRLSDFQQVVCSSPVRTQIFATGKADRNALFAAVIDAVGGISGLPVPIAVLSARLIQYGLDNLCAEFWEKQD